MSKNSNIKKKSRLKKIAIAIVILLILYAVTGFFIVPAIIKSQVASQSEKLLQKRASLGSVYVNPFTFYFEAEDFSLGEPGGEDLLSLKHLHADFELSSLFKRAFYFKQVYVTEPALHLKVYESGTNNFQDTLDKLKDIHLEVPTLLVNDLRVQRVNVSYTDRSLPKPFETRINPLDVTLTNFTTRAGVRNPYRISARMDSGETISAEGTVVVRPVAVTGSLVVEEVRPAHFEPYYAGFTSAQIQDGVMQVQANYELDANPEDKHVDIKISDGRFSLTNLVVRDPKADQTVVQIPSFGIGDIAGSYVNRSITVSNVTTTGGQLLVELLPDQSLNLLNLVQLPEKTEAETGTSGTEASPAKEWSVAVKFVSVDDYTIHATDESVSPPASLGVDQLGLSLNDVTLEQGASIPLNIQGRLNERGSMRIDGDIGLLPVSANLRFDIQDFDLPPYQVYAKDQVNADLLAGTVGAKGKLTFSMTPEGKPDASVEADATVGGLAIAEKGSQDPLIKIGSISVSRAAAKMEPLSARVENIAIADLDAQVVMAPDGGINLLSLIPESQPAAAGAIASATAKPSLPEAAINSLALTNATIHLRDESVQPAFAGTVDSLSGRIDNITTDPTGKMDMNFSGKLEGSADINVRGEATPLAEVLTAAVELTLRSLPLPPFAAYSGKFIGHPIEEGALNLKSSYHIDGQQLEGQNAILLKQLRVGDRLPNSEAPNLPVKFGVSMLKDAGGNIELNVPISGNLKDPSFNLRTIISQNIGTLIKSVASSPFKVLGSLVGSGGSGEELSFVAFEPGSAVLRESETGKLDKLAEALKKRPNLDLEIHPKPSTKQDREFFQERDLQAMLRRYAAPEPPPPAGAEAQPLQGERYEAAVRRAYAEKFGGTAASETGMNSVPPETVAEAAPEEAPEPRAPFFKRVKRFFRRIFVGEKKPEEQIAESKPESAGQVADEASEASGASSPSLEEMEPKLKATIEVDETQLSDLSRQRGVAVYQYLQETAGLDAGRMTLLESRPGDEPDLNVQLSLK